MSAETEIRAALTAIKKADGQRELIQAQFESARVCSDDNITALLAKIDALRVNAERAGQLVLAVRSWDSVDSDSDDASCEIEKLSQALADYDAAMADAAPPTALLTEMNALRIDAERCKTLFEVAMKTLSQIASTPRNKGARKNARATELFIQTQSDAAIAQFKKGALA